MPKRIPTHRPRPAATPEPRGNSAERGYGRRWRKLRLLKLAQEPICETPNCGRAASQVDHKLAKAKGGEDELSNLRSLCASCHSKKTVECDKGFGRALWVPHG